MKPYNPTVCTCIIRLSHATAIFMQLVVRNWANFQLHVSHATENQFHKTVAKCQISSSDVAWTWNENAQEAFNTFKEKLSEFPILKRPDFSKVFILHTNWNALGIGVILRQFDEEGREYVIAYASRSNKVESNYSSYEGECLVVVWAIIHFRPDFYGTKFILYTDHWPIKWLMTNDKFTSKLICWALIFQEYEYKVVH